MWSYTNDTGRQPQIGSVPPNISTESGLTIDENLTCSVNGPPSSTANTATRRHDDTTLTISSDVAVRVNNLTITDGNAGDGSGINNSGTLNLENSTVDTSSADSYGGGMYNNSSAALTLNENRVSGNSSTVFGGGIHNNGAMTVVGGNVSQNSAGYSGGGIFTGFGFAPVTLKDTTSATTRRAPEGHLQHSGRHLHLLRHGFPPGQHCERKYPRQLRAARRRGGCMASPASSTLPLNAICTPGRQFRQNRPRPWRSGRARIGGEES